MNIREEWTDEDKRSSRNQGWELAVVWDSINCREEYAILRYITRMDKKTMVALLPSDERAREVVQRNAVMGDELANKALRLFFVSRVKGVPNPKPEKRKTA
jgi:Rad3-related DNA helicase